MKKIFFVLALFISAVSFGQGDRMRPVYNFRGVEIADWYFQPTNYVYINQRYRWFMGMFDSGFHVPTTTVYPTLSAGQWTGAGGLKYRTTDTSFYGYTGYQWTRLASSQSVNQALANCYGLLNGLAVSYLSGLTFDVSPGDFTLGCFNFHSNGGQVTGTAAHATLARIDVVLVDTLGAVSILAGTAAADPLKPQVDPSYQLELSFYTVAALATTPTGVSSSTIYNENTEWTTSQNNWTASVAADFNNTTAPQNGTKHILISNTGTVGPSGQLLFVNGSVLNYADYTVLKFYIRLNSNFIPAQGISLRFANGVTFNSSVVNVYGGQFGFSRTTTGSYQIITIPISAFNATGTQFDRLYIFPLLGAKNFYLDVIQLQAGITQPPAGDPSTTNELQTLANTSAATTHTVTLSHSGGSIQLAEGSNITLTTTGTTLNGIVTIASTAGGGNVSNTGTPLDNQVAVFTNATTIEGTTGLTFSAGVLGINNTGGNDGRLDVGYIILKEINSLTTPPAGYGGVYAKDDGTLHFINDAGTDIALGAGGSGVTTMGAFGSTPNANGGTISGSTLTLQPADATNPGGVSTTTQAFAGNKDFRGHVSFSDGGANTTANLFITGNSNVFQATAAELMILSATAMEFRIWERGSTNAFIGSNESYVSHMIGKQDMTEAVSGTHAIVSQLAIKPLSLTDGVGATTNGATVYIEGAATGTATITNNYAFWVDAGITRFDGELNINGSAGTTGQVLTSAGAGAPPTWETSTVGSGTVQTGTDKRIAFYDGTGSSVNDWPGMLVNQTNLNTQIIAQAATDVLLELRMTTAQTADPFVIKNVAGNNHVQIQKDSKALFTTDATATLQNEDGFDNAFMIYGSGNSQFTIRSGSAYAETMQLLTHPAGFQGGLGGGNIGMRTNNALNFTTNATVRATITATGNYLWGGTAIAASATNTHHIFNGTAPTGSVANGVLLYSEDVATSAELKVRDEAGNITPLSPHNFTGIPEGRSEEMSWSFYSERDGKYINVDMLKLARLVEKLTGEKLIYTGSSKQKPNPKNK